MSVKFDSSKCNKFTYNSKKFHPNAISWKKLSAIDSVMDPSNSSEFDKIVCDLWTKIRDTTDGFAFNFTRAQCQYKIIKAENGMDGPMAVQLNPLRGLKKRTRPDFAKMDTPFNENGFQFKKIKNDEILFKMVPEFEGEEDLRDAGEGSSHYLIINAAPIEFGHILLVPELEFGHKQMSTVQHIRLGLDMLQEYWRLNILKKKV